MSSGISSGNIRPASLCLPKAQLLDILPEEIWAHAIVSYIGFDECALENFAGASRACAIVVREYLCELSESINCFASTDERIRTIWQEVWGPLHADPQQQMPKLSRYVQGLAQAFVDHYRMLQNYHDPFPEPGRIEQVQENREQLIPTSGAIAKLYDRWLWQALRSAVVAEMISSKAVPAWCWTNKEFVLTAVRNDGRALEYASEELRNDQEVVLEAVRRSGWVLMFASKELQNDRKVVLAAVHQDGEALEYASEWLKGDSKIVLTAVRNHGRALQHASISMRDDQKVVLTAVCQDGLALMFASERLRDDRKVVLAAVHQAGAALLYASEGLSNDRTVVLEAVSQNGIALQFASEQLKCDRAVVLEAVRQNGMALQWAAEKLKCDREVVLEAVRQNGRALQFVSEELRWNEEFISEALRHSRGAYASEIVFRSAIQRYPDAQRAPYGSRQQPFNMQNCMLNLLPGEMPAPSEGGFFY